MKIRHGEVICKGNIDTVKELEQLIIKSGLGTILHDASKGRHMMMGDYTDRSAFSKVYEIRLNGERLKLRLWYDKRDNTACVKAVPWHMAKLKRYIPGMGQALWKIAKSEGELAKQIIDETPETKPVNLLERDRAKVPV